MRRCSLALSATLLALCSTRRAGAQPSSSPRLAPYIKSLGELAGTPVVANTGYTYYVGQHGIVGYDRLRGVHFDVDSGVATDLAISPKGDQLAFASGEGFLTVWTLRLDPVTGRAAAPRRRLSVRSGRAPAFSPDGKWVAFGALPADTATTPRIIKVSSSGGPERVLTRQPGFAQTLRWSTDGKWIYYRHSRTTAKGPLRTLDRVSAVGGTGQSLVPIGEFVGVAPDGRLAYVTNQHFHQNNEPKHVIVADGDGRPLRRFDLPTDAMPIAWGPGEDQLLVDRPAGADSSSVHYADLNGRIRELTTRALNAHLLGVDGEQHIIVRADTNGRHSLFSIDLRSGARRVIFTAKAGDGAPGWLGRGYVALPVDGGFKVVNVSTGHARRISERECPAPLSRMRADLTLLCVARGPGRIELSSLNVESGAEKKLRRIDVSEKDRPGFWLVADTAMLLSVGTRVLAASVTGGPLRLMSDTKQYVISDYVASPDGRWLGLLGADTTGKQMKAFLRIVSLTTTESRDISVTTMQAMHPIGELWDPQDRFVAIGVDRGSNWEIWAVPLSGSAPTLLTRGETNSIGHFALAPDGSGIVYDTQPPASATASALWLVDLSSSNASSAP